MAAKPAMGHRKGQYVKLQSAGTGSDQAARTPGWLLQRLHEEFDFTLDPCPAGWSEADGYDGRVIPWGNGSGQSTAFVNPPYDDCEAPPTLNHICSAPYTLNPKT